MPVPPVSDYATFHEVARLIAAGEWQPNAFGWLFGGPIYPLVLAPLTSLGDAGLPAMRVLNALLQTAAVALCWVLARDLFGRPAAYAAAIIAAFLPGLWL
jgi:4-amino-4-deoxy-L-arabinose transferase-like glycosyltransferase